MQRVFNDNVSNARPEDMLSVARLLLNAQDVVEAIAHGTSMAPTIPSGATIRIQRVDPDSLRAGQVVAVIAENTLLTHRVVARGNGRVASGYVVTRGDGNTLCDPPLPVQAVLGAVTAYRAGDWCEIGAPIRRPGWRGLVTVVFDSAVRSALEVDVQLADRLARSGRRARALWTRTQRLWQRGK